MQLEIINFEKFNPRTDRKKHSWFRLENDFINDEKLFKLSPIEKFVWIGLLAFRSKKMEQIFDLDLEYLAEQLKVKKNIISSAIQKLSNAKALKIHEPVITGNQSVSTGSPTNERTDEQTNSECAEKEFETAWEKYPNKVDKGDARLRYFRLIKTSEDAKLLLEAIPKYVSNCHRENRKYKHFATFLGTEGNPRWQEWVNFKLTITAKGPVGLPPELEKPDPRTGAPLKPEFKNALDIALKRKPMGPTNEPPGAA